MVLYGHWIFFIVAYSKAKSQICVTMLYDNWCPPMWREWVTFEIFPFSRPQNIELGATGGASKQDSSKMEDMTVEQMTMRANQVTDEVLSHTNNTHSHTESLSFILSFCLFLSESVWNFPKGIFYLKYFVLNSKTVQATDWSRNWVFGQTEHTYGQWGSG